MAVNLVTVKMIAVFVGPVGMGLLGHFMSLATMVSVFAGGGIANGITKYVAEFRSQPRVMAKFIGAATVYGLVFSAIVLFVCAFLANPISRLLFGSSHYAWLVFCVGAAHLLCFIGTAVVAIANGLRRPDIFAGVTAVGYLGSLPIVYLLITSFGLEGAALSLLLVTCCTGVPAIWMVKRSRLTRLIKLSIDRANALRLGRFSMMLLASATLFPLAEIILRTRITSALGYEVAGVWQAMIRLSGAYLGFFAVFLATSYMPKLSSAFERADIIRLVLRYFVVILVVFALFALLTYLLRSFVIRLLFSADFDRMADFIGLQLIGDLFRLCSYVIGFLAVAKAATKIYIFAEFIQAGLYVGLSIVAISYGGALTEITQAYVLTYFLYLCMSIVGFVIYTRCNS